MKDVTKQLRHRYTIQWMKTFKFVLVEKLYAERSEAKKNFEFKLWNMVKYEWKSMLSEARLKKKYRTIKRGPKKLNFGASKPGVRGGARAPRAPPLDPLVLSRGCLLLSRETRPLSAVFKVYMTFITVHVCPRPGNKGGKTEANAMISSLIPLLQAAALVDR